MSTQQDIYVASSENRPPILNKENYIPWSSRLLCYAKSRPNGKLIYNSIINGPYVRRMIPGLADDQAIQTILLDLPEDIYAAVDSCETAQEIWFTSTDGESIESYYHRFSKLMNDFKRNKHFSEKEVDDLRVERLEKTHDPLALMENSNNPFNYPVFHPDQPSSSTYMQQPQPNNNYNLQPSFNQNYMQQPTLNPEDITDPTSAINMALVLIAKAFKLNYSTPTNNNQRISSNPRNRQIAQPGMSMGQDRQMQMVGGNGGNQFRQYAGQNVGNQNRYNAVQNVRNQVVQNAVQNLGVQNVRNQNGLIVVPGIANQNPNENGNVVSARAEDNANGNNADLDEIEEVNANCILMANLQRASTSGTQTDITPVYDSDGLAEVHNYDNCYDNEICNMFTQEEQYTELLEPNPEPHQVQQNDSNVISKVSSVEQDRGTVDQHPLSKEKSTVSSLLEEKKKLKSDFKIHEDELLDKQIQLENKIKELDNILVSEQKDTTKGTSVNTQFRKQSILGKPPSSSGSKLYPVTSFPKSKGLPKIDETHALSKLDCLGLILSRLLGVDNTTKTRRPQPRSNTKNDRVPSVSKSSCSKNKEVEVEKFLGTVGFGNDHVAAILSYGDLQWGNILITRVYFVEVSIGQFCDLDLEIAFRRNTCFVRNLEGVNLLKGNRTTNLYTINLYEMASASPICLMVRATSTKSWLWYQRLSHLNFHTTNDLAKNDLVIGLLKFEYHKEHFCPLCEQGKSKRASHPPKLVPNSKQRSKDEALEEIKTFLKKIIVLLQAPVIIVRTDNGTEFKNQVLQEYFNSVGISHHASSIRTPQQNEVVERRNHTPVEAAKTMLIFSRALLFLWAEAIATASGLDLTYALSTITTQQPTECKLDLLFESMYDDYIGGQPSAAPRTVPAAQAPQYVDELETQQQHVQQQDNQAPLQPKMVANNVPNSMLDGNTFVNPFAPPSTSAAESSSS
ncbi:retrovirus-related pol polyprotein from transposon TNT 1-94 [Tanacetum coccineum]